ncbi:DNA polymerase III subunit delta [Mycoplasma sp. OR1901]|uniref:DNA polymerase III subunit delta n=1 Tax=Mycoplasma sp. OR1901 TaxID=2742195 RepID=UPI00158392A8|nr:hypothetical protein [Mycoplasma sp. OR1901]QKT05296.1 hypothetical protein HTZ87_01085 [Mycoplasma sp. OR1901]
MKNIIFIYGDEEYFINNKIDELKSTFSEENIISFKDDFTISELIETTSSFGLFASQKLIIVNDFELINTKKLKKIQEHFISSLINLLNNNHLHKIVFVNKKNTFEKNDFTKFLIDNTRVFNFQKLDSKSIINFIISYIGSKGAKISFSDATFLSSKLPNNLSIIVNEIDKMLKFTKDINYRIISNNIFNYALDDSFAFMNAIETNNLKSIYQKYKERFNEGDDIPLLVAQLRNIFGSIYKVHILNIKLKMNVFEIANELKMQDWRVKKFIKLLNIYGIEKVKRILLNLSKVDIESKSLGVENYEIFETFLVTNFSK